ncbi:hypothetical protein [Modestobacter italicus]|uniref:hypothetical protein n=1 Tax=Modestobacter italicus (strain DSM 44449 / CECT 9708 / BC 501) TaxID=2732864 RepID=UPI001C9522D8|nr:hypothetical protein [Modestobacter italicus]
MTGDPAATGGPDGVEWEAVPYSGPPRYAQPAQPPAGHPAAQYAQPQYPSAGYAQPQYPSAGYAQPPYPPPGQWPAPYAGQQPWAPPPGRPGAVRPGTVVAAASLGFAAAALLLMCTLFLAAFAALLTVVRRPDAMAGPGVVVLQLVLAGLLVAGAALALAGRWRWLVLADGALLVLSVWWLVGARGAGQLLDTAPTVVLPVLFTLLAVTSAVLAALPASRAWAQLRTGTAGRPPADPEPGA